MSSDDLHKIIMQGETNTVEFKAEASEHVLRGMSTDLSAFANSQGGMIIFGVKDNKDPAGCELTGKERDRISQEASNCRPAILTLDFEEVAFGKRRFLVVRIPRSTVVHSDMERKFPVRVGNITDYLDGSGLAALLQERWSQPAVGPEGIVLTSSVFPTDSKRELPTDDATAEMAARLREKNSEIRLEAARDLAVQAHRFSLLAKPEIAAAAHRILKNGTEDEQRSILTTLRAALIFGTDEEKYVAKGFVKTVADLAKTTKSSNLAQMCIQPLLFSRDPLVIDVIVHLIKKTDDQFYAGVQPQNFSQDIRSNGIDVPLRRTLYDLLGMNSDERTRKRVSDLLAATRFY